MRIDLKIDPTLTHIAGNDFGSEIYKTQIKKFFDGKNSLEIWFPNNIEGVSISFVQGLIKEMVNQIGKNNVLTLISLKSDNLYLNDRLRKNMEF